jgi:hypothetical protein
MHQPNYRFPAWQLDSSGGQHRLVTKSRSLLARSQEISAKPRTKEPDGFIRRHAGPAALSPAVAPWG